MENQQLPNRKPTRMSEFDYSTPGAYFVTICTHEKAKILSRVEKIPTTIVGVGVPDDPCNTKMLSLDHSLDPYPYNVIPQIKYEPKLTEYGKIADEQIQTMNKIYENIHVDKYVIMPNHIHMIISISISGTSTSLNGTSRTPSPTNSLLSQFISTFKRYCNKKYGKNIWQRSFHDHIIRTEKEHLEIYEYIENNPFTWETDCFYNK